METDFYKGTPINISATVTGRETETAARPLVWMTAAMLKKGLTYIPEDGLVYFIRREHKEEDLRRIRQVVEETEAFGFIVVD